MRWIISTLLASLLAIGLSGPARADDKDVTAVLDKAIKALGGEEQLSKIKAVSSKSKGKITIGGNDNEFTSQATVQGLDHLRQEFEGEFGGNKIKGVTVLAGDKGWRRFGDMGMELDKDALATEKRNVYLLMTPVTIVPLKGNGFRVASAGEEKVGDKPAVVVKVTAPDGKDFKLYFDKESGLPVRVVAKVMGFMGDEATQETTVSDYKDFQGIKKATKIEIKRDGEKFLEQEITDFKVLDSVDPKTFEEPR
jgi:hypothetical protein